VGNLEATTAPRTRQQARFSDGHTIEARSNAETTSSGGNNGRVTTREIWRLIDNLKRNNYLLSRAYQIYQS
jgi:hypothetical protein